MTLSQTTFGEYAYKVQPGDMINKFKVYGVGEPDDDNFVTIGLERSGTLRIFKNDVVSVTRSVLVPEEGFSRNEMVQMYRALTHAEYGDLAYKVKRLAAAEHWDVTGTS